MGSRTISLTRPPTSGLGLMWVPVTWARSLEVFTSEPGLRPQVGWQKWLLRAGPLRGAPHPSPTSVEPQKGSSEIQERWLYPGWGKGFKQALPIRKGLPWALEATRPASLPPPCCRLGRYRPWRSWWRPSRSTRVRGSLCRLASSALHLPWGPCTSPGAGDP